MLKDFIFLLRKSNHLLDKEGNPIIFSSGLTIFDAKPLTNDGRVVYYSVDGRHLYCIPYLLYIAMINPKNKKPVRKPRNVLIDPEALHKVTKLE